jgi:hypothetical protein
MSPAENFLSKLENVQQSAKGWTAKCPAHDDRNPSLSISEGEGGRALVRCFAGCKTEDVCKAVGLSTADLMPQTSKASRSKPPQPRKTGPGELVATYEYRDELGNLLFQVQRFEPKTFRQRQPGPNGTWSPSVKGVRVVPYRLPELLAKPQAGVFVVEGEKDADNLAKMGFLATCNACGAGKWNPEHAAFLKDRIVVILADNDQSGANHAQQVALSLVGIAKAVKIVNLPGLPEKGDVSDWIAAGGTAENLRKLIQDAPEWKPPSVDRPWPEIEPIDEVELPEFPTHALPQVLRNWVPAGVSSGQRRPEGGD